MLITSDVWAVISFHEVVFIETHKSERRDLRQNLI